MVKIIFVHSAGSQRDNQGSYSLISYLQNKLQNIEMIAPQMPNPENPTYEKWSEKLKETIMSIDDTMIFIGHSLGGTVILKYLSENNIKQTIKGIYIIGAPFWGMDKEWINPEFNLSNQAAKSFTLSGPLVGYYGKKDEIVSETHATYYADIFHNFVVEKIEDASHLFERGLPELVVQIQNTIE